jgi:hypothetical protein
VDILVDDDPRGEAVSGFAGHVIGHVHFLEIGSLRPLRLSLFAGVELLFGDWRDAPLFAATADIGLRLALGSPSIAATLTVAYNVGVALAERRTDFVYASYRVSLGARWRLFGIGVSFQELGRDANATLRSVTLYSEWLI